MRFEWQKLVTPLTPKATVAEWQAKNAEIVQKTNEAAGTSLTVEPVDWAYWKTQITTPGLVEQMQKDYEALKFPVHAADSPENTAKLDAILADVAKAKKEAVHAANEVVEADKVIATVNKVKAEGLTWSLEQWQAFMPGLAEQHKAEFEDEDYIVSDEALKLDNVDWKAAAKEYAAGGNPDLGVADERIGDLSLKEEMDLVDQGKWSVARVFAGKEERARIQERVEKALS
jgi:hypothetical protein